MTRFDQQMRVVMLSVGAWLAFGPLVFAVDGDVEVRDFSVHVDGKPAGTYHMTLRQDQGAMVIACKAEVSVRYLVMSYTYSYRGTEVWRSGRLQRLESTSNDDGKRYATKAWAEGKVLRVVVNGQEHAGRTDAWTTSYWHAPDSRLCNQVVPLLDCDTGKDLSGTLEFIDANAIAVAGQTQKCTHYRLRGKDVQVDVWYDAQERLVREESMEDGHRTLLELSRPVR